MAFRSCRMTWGLLISWLYRYGVSRGEVLHCCLGGRRQQARDQSHASFESKLLRVMAKACKIDIGHCTSMLNSSLPTRPNCNVTVSWSSGSTSWKFLTDAIVTRPLKLSTYAPT